MTIYNIHTLYVCTYISQNIFLRNAFAYTLFIYRSICTTHAHTVTKITKKPKGSNGSMVYSLGMGGDTAKKTRMAKKSLRRTAIKNSSHIKGKRVGKQQMKKPAGGRPSLTHIPNVTVTLTLTIVYPLPPPQSQSPPPPPSPPSGLVAKTKRTQVAGKKKKESSQVCVRAHGLMGYV